jgi:ubiquinone/menaquinone biosynthesis C-methylase UbiE
MDSKETVKAGYNQIANRYLEERTRDSEDILLLNELIRRLPNGAEVLDAGCGAGVPVAQILDQNFQVTGIDFSEAQIELSRKHVPNARFICQDMTKLDFPNETFDAICSYYAIIHIPREEHKSLFANFHRMLKDRGFALLCLGAESILEDIDENFLGARMFWSHFDGETYLRMLKEAGFSIIWSRRVKDSTCEGAAHLFVLAQKAEP